MQQPPPSQYRAVTARDLARRTAALLDDVENLGLNLLVVRRGLPVAVVAPTDNGIFHTLAGPARQAANDESELISSFELEPLEIEVLRAVSVTAYQFEIAKVVGRTFNEIAGPLFKLEMKDAIDRRIPGYWLTRLGQALLDRLPESDNGEPQ